MKEGVNLYHRKKQRLSSLELHNITIPMIFDIFAEYNLNVTVLASTLKHI